MTKHTPEDKQQIDENGLIRYKDSSDAIFDDEAKKKISKSLLFGYDIDKTMVRIGLMNLMLHGISHPMIERRDTLSSYAADKKYSVVMANPPFTGTVSEDELSSDLKSYGKKSELLFLVRIIKMLKNGGRAAVIVPEGVLFAKGKAKEIREKLLRDCSLTAVISGVFKPYAGVKTAILLFAKVQDDSPVWHTDDVWFYELPNDGYSLDDNRRKLKDNPLPIAEQDFAIRNELEKKTKQYFHLSIEEIEKNNLELRFDKYKLYDDVSVDVKPPHKLMEAILELEDSLRNDLFQLNEMI